MYYNGGFLAEKKVLEMVVNTPFIKFAGLSVLLKDLFLLDFDKHSS